MKRNADQRKSQDQSVDGHLIRHCFTNDAWLIVQDVPNRKREHHMWICRGCSHNLDKDQARLLLGMVPFLMCWIKQPKQKYWFCRDCHNHVI